MLVLQKAVFQVESGQALKPTTPLEEMHQRFMTVQSPTPLGWAIHLRSFGKRIVDSTTSLGYILWSDNEQTMFYKDLEIHIPALQGFLRDQVAQAQGLPQDLFLLCQDETRESAVPAFSFCRLRDNPTVIEKGWNFLADKRNSSTLPNQDLWLLNRILQNQWLREVFVSLNPKGRVV
jgi:hypothetical protein